MYMLPPLHMMPPPPLMHMLPPRHLLPPAPDAAVASAADGRFAAAPAADRGVGHDASLVERGDALRAAEPMARGALPAGPEGSGGVAAERDADPELTWYTRRCVHASLSLSLSLYFCFWPHCRV